MLSGTSDRPIPELGYRTPLQYAYKRNLNDLANKGVNGLMYPVSAGIKPGAATSVFSILGYDKRKYPGLSPIINAGLGAKLSTGDLTLRGSFASVDNEGKIVSPNAGGLEEGGKIFALSLDGMRIDGVKVSVKSSDEVTSASKIIGTGECGVVLHGKDLSDHIIVESSNDKLPTFRSVNTSDKALKTANVLNEFMENVRDVLKNNELNSKRILRKKLPVNCLILNNPAIVPDIKRFSQRYGVKGVCVAGDYRVKGVTKVCGMDSLNIEGATGFKNTNLIAKMDAAIDSLMNADLVLLHIKIPDIYSAEKDVKGKVDAIERADTALGYLLQEIRENAVIGVTCDYTRSTITGERTGDAVPISFFSPDGRKDEVREFDELACVSGHVGRFNGMDVIPYLLNLMDRPIELCDMR